MAFNPFVPARKEAMRARVAIVGPTGAGKTWDALLMAETLAPSGRVAFIDTENRSGLLYADRFRFDHMTWEPPYSPVKLREMILFADGRAPYPGSQQRIDQPYDVVVIDSLTHFWKGEGGTIDRADSAAKRYGGNSFAGWKEATPELRALLDAMIFSPAHIIVTMRSRMEHVQERDNQDKVIVRRIGLAPEMRNDIEYEFTIALDVSVPSHEITVSKSRCSLIADQVVAKDRAGELFQTFARWLDTGVQMPTPAEVDQLKAAFDVYEDVEDRKAAKRAFLQHWGPIDHIDADTLPKALAWIDEQADVYFGAEPEAQGGSPLPAEATPEMERHLREPGGAILAAERDPEEGDHDDGGPWRGEPVDISDQSPEAVRQRNHDSVAHDPGTAMGPVPDALAHTPANPAEPADDEGNPARAIRSRTRKGARR